MTTMKTNRQVEEDFQAWDLFKNTEHRWVFNKLEVAIRQGLECGPAATAPEYSGRYIHRPIYNLYGMGIGATQFYYDKDHMYEKMINHDVVPPGHFWCEWASGSHLSIDYEKEDGLWKTRSTMVGEHYDNLNLTRFKSWEKLSELETLNINNINKYVLDLPFLSDPTVEKVNIEAKYDYEGKPKIVEIHLRWGNDPFDDLPIGTRIVPVWSDQEVPEGEWRGNLHEDMSLYCASGNLSDVRKGYIIKRP